MPHPSVLFLSVSLACAACSAAPKIPAAALVVADPAAPAARPQDSFEESLRFETFPWAPGQPLMHGFLGVSKFSSVEVSDADVDGDDGDLDQLPVIGGGAQWKLGGDRVALGMEGLLSFSWRADAEAFVIGGGGAAVAVDVDLMLLELYGGPFASMFLGEKLRLYGAAGPLLQFADYQQSGGGPSDDGSGFGAGWYARTGLEFALPSRTLIGFGVRWSDTTVDLGGGLGDLEIDGLQGLFTVSRGL